MRIILALIVASWVVVCSACAAAGDIKISQKNSTDTAWLDVVMSRLPNGVFITGATGVPQLVIGSLPVVLTTSTLATTDQRYLVMNSASPQTITLPAVPFDGEPLTIKAWGTGLLTVAGGAANIDASSTRAMRQYECVTLTYSSVLTAWLIGN